jgi:hypothetical protein
LFVEEQSIAPATGPKTARSAEMATAVPTISASAVVPASAETGPDRQPLLRLLNLGLQHSWRMGVASKPRLTAAAMIAEAKRRTGLSEFGPEAQWRPALSLLARSLVREAGLNALGRTIAYGQIVGILMQRLRAHALWAEHPEILERPIASPIIVLGHMRSGSTRLQRLLACDPRFAHTRFFESWRPVPHRRGSTLDDRKWRAGAALHVARMLNPRFTAIHPTALSAPDEEIGFHAFSLCGAPFEAQWRIPSFARHWEEADLAPVYREFKALLQTIGWLRGEPTERPWILKVPQFMQDLPALLDAFPDARLLCLDRDPAQVIASSASLALNQMQIQSDEVDPHWLGQEWLRKVALRERIARTTRANASVAQLDISFAAMNADWLGEIRRVYAFLDLDLPDEVEAKMRAYVAAAHGHAHKRPRYSLADFGLTRRDVAAALAPQPDVLAAE